MTARGRDADGLRLGVSYTSRRPTTSSTRSAEAGNETVEKLQLADEGTETQMAVTTAGDVANCATLYEEGAAVTAFQRGRS